MQKQLLIAYIIFIAGCRKKNEFIYDVPAEFETYVKRFITEARARGHTMEIDNLIIKYDAVSSSLYCATSNTISPQNDEQKIILVNPQVCGQNDVQLEALIFHELGHCILGRNHDTSLMPGGDAKTLLYPDDITLYSPCVYNIGTPCDLTYRRPYYIDELFNPSAPVPDWAK